MKNISILGVTGSIGTQTLEVIRNSNDEFKILGISANTSCDKVIDIIEEFNPKHVAMMDHDSYIKIKDYCIERNLNIEVHSGLEGLNKIATLDDIEMVVTSVVGMIGLVPTINAIRAKKDIALANKETLVVAGEIVMKEAKENGVKILPVDSEHCAVFQCLQGNDHKSLNKVILTGSGGPFRGKKREELKNISPEQALKHPKWNMGRKISIDSSTLVNKGLEVIEAHYLFDMPYENIEVVIHPETIIHSMVEYIDGSVIAQLGNTDMKLPIQYALNYPDRKASITEKLDFYTLGSLTFEKPDMDTFGCLKLAYEAGKKSGNMPAIMNASNEVAVELFLNRGIEYLQIEKIIRECMEKFQYVENPTLEEIIEVDSKVRDYVREKYKL
ncbi:MAG: 1-deoxy-D-xylulose-5-phosphate reductoisomerase [Clostridium argentinense]|uniref:1-deoxy-D-xylulose 5-phosphate reductoisomerase n=1 Tax=Clostridium faecium TaxID=2762223 RepID=A0ABR8YV06_9CLOT|nr:MULTISPECIES: 1-deoxy-D-xylulose-5-phosphate reductoisomerase [Clostridium]MBD8048111.1 1-deoxy-D-xylulose-5-phosphate reductoisomerase [Clostridium faecium]MBS5823752.1 1-deoxy-D-xylulose-5-phosphate reductoisomerase [Clostridium argentinense]MDU1348156.1 1-deoxy-D-xylulose-5-phosphate reductoisomerase [Clostridium argentinense]